MIIGNSRQYSTKAATNTYIRPDKAYISFKHRYTKLNFHIIFEFQK